MAKRNESPEQKAWRERGLVKFQPGQSGNPGGKVRGFNRIMRDLLKKKELNGEAVPGGRTVEEALVEACLMQAIKGSVPHLVQVLDRTYGKAGDVRAESGIKVTFEIVDNHRDSGVSLGSPGVPGDGPTENTNQAQESRGEASRAVPDDSGDSSGVQT